MKILVDADACPVKDEVYRVARRHGLPVVRGGELADAGAGRASRSASRWSAARFDAADDRIVERAEPGDVVVSNDIPLAARCIAKGGEVLAPRAAGSRGAHRRRVATRDLMAHLRGGGTDRRRAAAVRPKDRSRFLDAARGDDPGGAPRATRRS